MIAIFPLLNSFFRSHLYLFLLELGINLFAGRILYIIAGVGHRILLSLLPIVDVYRGEDLAPKYMGKAITLRAMNRVKTMNWTDPIFSKQG